MTHNKSLKPTAHACHALCRKAKPAPRYGGLVPPLYAHLAFVIMHVNPNRVMMQRSKLRIHFPILITLFLCAGVILPMHGNPMQKTIISGVITNFEDPYDLPAIELYNYMPFISEWNTYSQFIEKDGVFRFEFEQMHSRGIMIKFKEMFSVYANPGDSIYINIDARMLSDTSETKGFENKYIQIECANQRFQDEYQEFTQAFYGEFNTHDSYLAQREAQKNLNHIDYTEYVKEQSRRHYAFLEDYIQSNQPLNDFQKWADNWLYISEQRELLRYAWLHPKYNELDRTSFILPEEYFCFLEDLRHNDERLLNSQVYFGFLHELYMHLYRGFHQSDLSSEYDSLYSAGNTTEANRLNLRYIIDRTDGFEQEFLVSRFFSRLIYWKLPEVYDALYDPSLVGREDYNQVLTKEYAELQQLIEKPVFAKDLNLHQSGIAMEDLVFNTLPGRFPDKVIYVDFWAPWCGPCMAEMPHSKELQEQMKGQDIVFVFLASSCTETAWKATISQKQLSGEHFLLDDKEYSMLAGTFNIAGIPRYMIIDKKGQVVNDNAARPSDEKLVGVLETLSVK